PFTKSYSYGYYANGQKQSLTYPDATTVTFDYNANGQLTAIDLPGGDARTRDFCEIKRTTSESIRLPVIRRSGPGCRWSRSLGGRFGRSCD
ncbi:MAG: RHS repeat domain-containing protein, partial [Anaerolineales bacterium]|nr:RHS repeat domain-containing protein [Anaerolineales bacterium]